MPDEPDNDTPHPGPSEPEAQDSIDRTLIQPRGMPAFGAGGPGREGVPAEGMDYDIRGEIGAGGMGVVYDVQQKSLDRRIAMKVRRPLPADSDAEGGMTDFMREAHITASLEHPHVVPVHTLSQSVDGRPFFTMKRVVGISWRDVLHPDRIRDEKARKRAESMARSMTFRDHLHVFCTAAEAVAYAHSKGIVHRDLKPGNVLLGEYDQIYVMDWGLAMYFDDRNPYSDEPARDAPLSGSPAYMSPEMARGERERIGPQSDVYQLGLILYELLTGAPPPRGGTVQEILKAAATGHVRPPEEVSDSREINPDISRIVMKAVAPQIPARYQDVSELLAELQEYLAHASSLDQTRRSEKLLVQLCEELQADPGARPARVRDIDKDNAALLYGRLSECIGGLRQAIAAWPGNERAVSLLVDAMTLQVALATAQGDLTLAKAQAAAFDDPPLAARENHEAVATIAARRQALQAAIRRKEALVAAAARQVRALRTAATVLLALVLIGIGTTVLLSVRGRMRALRHEEEVFASAVAGQARMVRKHFETFERTAAQYRQEAVRLMAIPSAHLPYRLATPAGRDGYYLSDEYYDRETRPPDTEDSVRYGHAVSRRHAVVVAAPWAGSEAALQAAQEDARRLARLNTIFMQTHNAHPEIRWSLAGSRTGLLVGYPGGARYRDKPEYDPTGRAWYLAAIDAPDDRPVWGVPYADASSRRVLMSCMCRIAVGGKTVGVVGLELTLESLQQVLSDFEVESGDNARCLLVRGFEEPDARSGATAVVDRIVIDTSAATEAGHWQDTPKMVRVDQAGPLVAELYSRASADAPGSHACIRTGRFLMSYARLPGMDWTLLVVVAEDRGQPATALKTRMKLPPRTLPVTAAL